MRYKWLNPVLSLAQTKDTVSSLGRDWSDSEEDTVVDVEAAVDWDAEVSGADAEVEEEEAVAISKVLSSVERKWRISLTLTHIDGFVSYNIMEIMDICQ